MITKLKTANENGVTLKIIGNILSVLEGRVEDKVLKQVDQNELFFALGSGSFSQAAQLGETIVIGGNPYISWVEEGKVHTQTRPTVRTSFLMGIDRVPTEGVLHAYSPKAPTSIQSFYEEKSKDYPQGFILIAKVVFSELYSTYLMKAPIYQENINQNSAQYWAKIPVEKDKSTCFFGVVIPSEGKKKFPENVLKKAFYQNPADAGSSNLMSHSHGAILKSGMINLKETQEEFFSDVNHLPIDSIRHLLTQSLIREGLFILLPIHQIIEI